ncbi:hypothetical protein [Roseateles sp.]|uniref:hypothetical protein n=1 Tax=Roseateles sp. TaxID=1971397 RepID=UPI002F42EB76
MINPLIIAFVAGVPVVFYVVWVIFIFKSIGRDIAIAQGRADELDQPGKEGFNGYEMNLYRQLKGGAYPLDIPPGLAARARDVGNHLKWSMRIAASWIFVLLVIYWVISS